jgi:transketolase
VREIDGHNMREIVKAAASIPFQKGKPSIIIANTIKGKSLKFAENQVGFHYWKAKDEEIAMAEKDLEEIGRRLGV